MSRVKKTTALIAVLFMMGGCVTLRKMFTRKSKTEQVNERKTAVKAAIEKKDRAGLLKACFKWPRRFQRLGCQGVVDLAVQEGDSAALRDMCGKKGEYSKTGKNKIRWNSSLDSIACQAHKAGGLVAMEKDVSSATCQTVVAICDRHASPMAKNSRPNKTAETRTRVVALAAVKLAKCGKWDYLIERIVPLEGQSEKGKRALEAVAKGGFDVEKNVLGYMRRHKQNLFKFRGASKAFEHYFDYLGSAGKHSRCGKYVPFADKMSPNDFFHFSLFSLQCGSCPGVVKIVGKRLLSSDVVDRLRACETLAKFGSKKHLKKLKIVARTDPFFKIRKRVKIYTF